MRIAQSPGLQLNMLQEFVMIPLDIYHGIMDNKIIETPLEAWLTFMACDEPERIIELITRYPEFKPMYETLYQMCLNVERVMEMSSGIITNSCSIFNCNPVSNTCFA